jgi:hypothetical protein
VAEPEPLTLEELHLARTAQEGKARALRVRLHELRATRPPRWEAEFSRTQAVLIKVVSRISDLNLRIHKAVAGEAPEDSQWLI